MCYCGECNFIIIIIIIIIGLLFIKQCAQPPLKVHQVIKENYTLEAVASEPVEKWDGSTASASPLLPSPLLLFLPLPLPCASPPLPLEVGPLKSS